jgi:hypothetical protein
MKTKLNPIVFILFFLFLQLPYASFASSPLHAFNDSVTVKIELVEEFSGFGTSYGGVSPSSGAKFIAVHVNVSNISDSKQEFRFVEVCLLDPVKKIKYKPTYFMKATQFTIIKKPDHTIKKGDHVRRRLVYNVPDGLMNFEVFYNNKILTAKK